MIRELREADAEAFVELRREALLDTPLAFGVSPEDDVAASPEWVREYIRRSPDQVIFGAFDQDGLVGIVGMWRGRHAKTSHRMKIWGTYVSPSQRGKGLGTELLAAAIRHARASPGVAWVDLSVSATTPGARRIYERAGFEVWGTERDTARHAGQSSDEHHMTLRIE